MGPDANHLNTSTADFLQKSLSPELFERILLFRRFNFFLTNADHEVFLQKIATEIKAGSDFSNPRALFHFFHAISMGFDGVLSSSLLEIRESNILSSQPGSPEVSVLSFLLTAEMDKVTQFIRNFNATRAGLVGFVIQLINTDLSDLEKQTWSSLPATNYESIEDNRRLISVSNQFALKWTTESKLFNKIVDSAINQILIVASIEKNSLSVNEIELLYVDVRALLFKELLSGFNFLYPYYVDKQGKVIRDMEVSFYKPGERIHFRMKGSHGRVIAISAGTSGSCPFGAMVKRYIEPPEG